MSSLQPDSRGDSESTKHEHESPESKLEANPVPAAAKPADAPNYITGWRLQAISVG
jgi:hypothetical protein